MGRRMGSCVGSCLDSSGIPILQQTPSELKTSSAVPPSSCGTISRIRLLPNPDWAGAVTCGPPLSRHSMVTFEAPPPLAEGASQLTETSPPGLDKAPYFAAFVTSSWITMATTCVVAAPSRMFGPVIRALASVA